MYEKLLLFNDELDKLRVTGWGHKVLYRDDKNRVYCVKIDVPEEIGDNCDYACANTHYRKQANTENKTDTKVTAAQIIT